MYIRKRELYSHNCKLTMRKKTILNLIILLLATLVGVGAGAFFILQFGWHEGWSLAAAGLVWIGAIVGFTKVIRPWKRPENDLIR